MSSTQENNSLFASEWTDEDAPMDPVDMSDRDYEQFLYRNYFLPDIMEWSFLPLFGLLLLAGLLGNSLVTYVVARNPLMRTVTNFFLVNLAIADFFVILLCMPFTLLWDITSTWHFGTAMCKIIAYVNIVSVSVSILTLTAISVERWYAICHPLAFTATPKRTVVIIVLIWCVSMLVSLPELIVLETSPFVFEKRPNFTSKYFHECKDTWGQHNQQVYQLVQSFLLFLFPICLMAVMYGHIAVVLWRQRIPSDELLHSQAPTRVKTLTIRAARAVRRLSYEQSKEKEVMSRRKAAKMLIAVVIMFGICYFPTHLRNILLYFRLWPEIKPPFDSLFQMLMRFLCYLNSCINPLIYNFMSEKFRKEFRKIFVCLPQVSSRRQSNYANAATEKATLLDTKSIGLVAIAIAQISYEF